MAQRRHNQTKRINAEGRPEYDQMAQAALVACWVAPLVSWILLYTYAARVEFHLGYWPSFGNPDPTRLGWIAHHTFTWLALLGSVLLLLIAIFISLFFTWYHAQKRWKNLAITLLVALIWFLTFSIPGASQLLTWIMN